VVKVCSRSNGGFAQVGNTLDRPELSVQAVSRVAEVLRNAEIWGRFGQESRSFVQRRQLHARYAKWAEPHKHCLFRILLIWRVGT